MPHFNDYILDQLLVPAVVPFFFIGGLLAVAVGMGLVVSGDRVFRLFGLMNFTVSTRRALRPMAMPRDIGHFVWTYRGWFGAFFVVGAGYAVYAIARVDNSAVVSLLNLKLPRLYVFWLVESTRLFLLAGCTVSIAVGILLGFFPDAMRAIEKRASHWYSTRRFAPDAEKMNLTLDHWVAAFPRTAGWIIVFPALGMVVYFGSQLLGRS